MLRLYVPHPLASAAALLLDEKQSHYLNHVMRAKEGDTLLLFNGHNGEWRASITALKKQGVTVLLEEQLRIPKAEPDLWLLFAPIKRNHGDLAVEKASELGASKLIPILTQRTVVSRVPIERYRSIAIEAAEQCERLSIPEIARPQKLESLLENWDARRLIILCAEAGEAKPLALLLRELPQKTPLAVLVGPEGGFTPHEFDYMRSKNFVFPARLGPRILRADTAAIAALSLVQALQGDWTDTKGALG